MRNMSARTRVLFVCLGNICRSPLAEGIFVKKINERGIAHLFHVDSCGTGDYHIGQLPDPRTRKNSMANGVTLEHRCRQITEEDLRHFDLILAMDDTNYMNILKLDGASEHTAKIRMMRSFEVDTDETNVPDPYFGNERDFQEVFEILDRCTEGLLSHLHINH